MASDQFVYQMGPSTHENEVLDFDTFFDFPSALSDSNPTSVTSVSPKDLDLSYTDVDGSNWGSQPEMCPQEALPELFGYNAPFEDYIESPWGVSGVATSDPNNFLGLPPAPLKEDVAGSDFESAWMQDVPDLGDPFYSSLRQMVESQAAVDTRVSSSKEKRREAAIAIHLQRLNEAPMVDLDTSPESNTSFSSPCISNAAPSVSPVTTPSGSTCQSTPMPGTDPSAGGLELVLDMNMNTTTNVPKKQKPRSRAQRENYIKARKYGACEKHRKQHKRCNCLEKAAAQSNINNAAVAPSTTIAGTTRLSQLHVHSSEQVRPIVRPRQTPAVTSSNVQLATTANRNGENSVQPVSSRHTTTVTPDSLVQSGYVRPSLEAARPRNVNSAHPRVCLQSQTEESPGRSTSLAVSAQGHRPLAESLLSRLSSQQSLVPRTLSTSHRDIVNHSGLRNVDQPSDRQATRLQPYANNLATDTAGSRGLYVDSGTVGKLISATLQSPALACCRFWQNLATIASVAGTLFGRFAVFSSKQHWLVRKGMDLI